MSRPSIPKIKTPTAKSQLSKENEQVSGGVCGGSWPHSFELIRPYSSTSNYSKYLDALGDYEDPDILPNFDFIARIEDAIENTWEDLDKFHDDGVIDADKYEKIRTIQNRASNYANIATKLYSYWAEEYVPPDAKWGSYDPDRRPPGRIQDSYDAHWPLEELQPFLGNCGSAYADAAAMKANSGKGQSTNFRASTGGLYKAEFKCPSISTINQHIGDIDIYGKLIKAAARNARCAQELTYTIAFFKLNKSETETPERMGQVIKGVRVRQAILLPEEPGAVEDEPSIADEDKKTGAGTILALGAAAIALLALTKR